MASRRGRDGATATAPDGISGAFSSGWRWRPLADPSAVRLGYRPVVDLRRGVVCGFEVHAAVPIGRPRDWFARLADRGLAGPLEAAVVRAALAQRPALPPNCFLSLELTPGALVRPEVTAAFLASRTLDGVVVGVTAQASAIDHATLQRALEPLREHGARICAGDVGSQHVSLDRLVRLRPDFVKLDRALIGELDADRRREAVVEAIGALANRLDAWIVAEGIERQAELAVLVRLGVPLGLGPLLGTSAPQPDATPPHAAAAIRRLVRGQTEALSVRPLVERTPVVRCEPDGELPTSLGERRADLLVVLDRLDRPLGLLQRDELGGPHRAVTSRPLCVKPSECIRAVAARAMARPPEQRFQPIVCCDGRGRYSGTICVERLVEELARQPDDVARTLAERAVRAEREALVDALTGVGNRRAWEQRLRLEERRCASGERSIALVSVDLDRLKQVNDRDGHSAGDALIQRAAATLAANVRHDDFLARLGGDEFGVLLIDCDAREAAELTTRLRDALASAGAHASLGCAIHSGPGLAQAWDAADAAMYRQKRAPRSSPHPAPTPQSLLEAHP